MCTSYNGTLYTVTGLDDSCVDDVLGDGIHDQDLLDNDCYKEIQSHMDLRSVSRNDYETVTAEEAIKVLIRDSVSLSDPIKKRLQNYQVYFISIQKKFRHSNTISIINYCIYIQIIHSVISNVYNCLNANAYSWL